MFAGEVRKQLEAAVSAEAETRSARRHRRGQPRHSQHRDDREGNGGVLERRGNAARSSSRPWAATAPRRPGQAEVLAHYGITEATWAARSSASSKSSRWADRDGIEAFMDARPTSGRRDAGGPRQVAHRFRRQDRERALQDDGDRPGQVRRRAALSHIRIQARPGERHPQRRPAGA